MLLQAISADDRVGDQSVGGHDASQQERSHLGVVHDPTGEYVGDDKGHYCGEQTKNHIMIFRLPHTLHVHLKSGQEHDVEHAYLAEKLKGVITLEDVEPIFSHQYTCKHHSYDMGNPQLTHDDGCQQDDAEHDEEDQRRVRDGEVMGYFVMIRPKCCNFATQTGDILRWCPTSRLQ